jgi:hypothetical protein
VLLDIHRSKQDGLSFRVFESLGKEKKIITTNTAVKNYDFYIPNNILIIDINNLILTKEFFQTKYEPLSKTILEKYYIENWVDEFLN